MYNYTAVSGQYLCFADFDDSTGACSGAFMGNVSAPSAVYTLFCACQKRPRVKVLLLHRLTRLKSVVWILVEVDTLKLVLSLAVPAAPTRVSV